MCTCTMVHLESRKTYRTQFSLSSVWIQGSNSSQLAAGNYPLSSLTSPGCLAILGIVRIFGSYAYWSHKCLSTLNVNIPVEHPYKGTERDKWDTFESDNTFIAIIQRRE